ncbi:MAG: hypothetical protein BM562_18275 [Alphaproteobacteria bacterium MedPE-SWcel]|nr:MAG: hypothetical protein BM562_18275 [Alphaproteobacteria bacterium MedPE-SWcel]
MRILFPCLAVLARTGCFGSTASVDGADPCARPVQIPQRWLNDREVETLWARDRHALLDCAGKVEGLSGRGPV